jgi:PAS domain S-box-containing protein
MNNKGKGSFNTEIISKNCPLVIMTDHHLNIKSIKGPDNEKFKGFINARLLNILPVNQRNSIQEAINQISKNRDRQKIEGRINNRNSGTINFQIISEYKEGTLSGYIIIFTNSQTSQPKNITETNAVSEESGKYRKLIESSLDPIYVLQKRQLKLVNTAWERLFGYSRAEVVEQDFDITNIVAPESRNMAERKLKVPIEERNKISRYEFKGLTKDGRKLDIEASVTRIKWNGDYAYQGIYRDITEKKRSKEALAEKEKKYRTVFENTGSATFIIEKDKTISLANSQVEELTGYSPSDIEGKMKWTAFVAEQDLPKMRRYHRLRRSNNSNEQPPGKYEFELIDKEGNSKYMLNTVSIIPGTDKSVASFNDITKLKNTQKQLRKTADRYNALYDRSNDLIYTLDFEGNIIDTNPAVKELLGYSDDELKSFDIFALITNESDIENMEKTLNELIEQGYHKEPDVYQLYTKNGDRVWIETQSVIIYENEQPRAIQGIARNITEQKKMEKALRKREKEFRKIFNNVNDAIYLHTIDENNMPGEFLRVNDVACKMLGYTREELLNKSPMDIDAEHKSKYLPEIMEGLVKQGKKTFEMVHETKNGDQIPVEVSSHLFKIDAQEVVLSVARNIKERKKAEAEKEKLRQEVLQTQKLESIGKLAGGVAHDFNNLLTIIQGQSQLAQMELDSDNKIYTKLEQVIEAAERASNLTRQLLLFSRRQETIFETIDLNEIVSGLYKMLKRLIGEDIDIKTELKGGLWNIYADKGQIEQIITNLAVNARDAIQRNGIITIRTKNVTIDEEDARTIPDIEPGEFVRLELEDNGNGIPEDVINKIFDPFFTTKGPEEGTGMGLAVVHGIVHKHDGWINLESEPGKGTKFIIYIPATSKEPEIEEEFDYDLDKFAGKGERVLVVEDERPLLHYVSDVLQDHNYQTYEAENPQIAVQMFRENSDEIKLLISDVIMPGMRGDELAEKLQDFKPELNVILSSGYTHDKVKKENILSKGYKFIRKPYDLRKLLETTREILEG